ncbi:MAG: hypothetical protein BMS9Abin17_0829 [Acidimicrobiia bacterium]|nr:MAG: hypothetical protein BMS9Abin17_0829 [Acidimicrobiia bacterium]
MGDAVPLKASYQGNDEVIPDDATALVGSDAASTIRIVRPGISRKHAVLSFDGSVWKIEDAGSRNGTFKDGQRIQILALEESTTVYLGHPTDGESLVLTPINDTSTSDESETDDAQGDIDAFVLPIAPPAKTDSPGPATEYQIPVTEYSEAPSVAVPVESNAGNAELVALTAALRDQINAVKGLTWSVWAMIAVTAALAVMTLFVGILGN